MSMSSPRIATENPFDTQPASFDYSMFEDGSLGVHTTSGRISTAIRQKWRNSILID